VSVECVMCGYCCGYRRDSHFGGCSYAESEVIPPGIYTVPGSDGTTIPVDSDDVCIYLEKLDNGFARCSIQSEKPAMCKLYNCLTLKKARYLQAIVDSLQVQGSDGE
jgi:Fe-S-cluster containining protein